MQSMSGTGVADVAADDGSGGDGAGARPPSREGWQGSSWYWSSWDASATTDRAGSGQWAPDGWQGSWWQGRWERRPMNNWDYGYSGRQSSWPGYYRPDGDDVRDRAQDAPPQREAPEEQRGRRAFLQSTTVTDDLSAEANEDAKESSDAGSQSKVSPKTGKDYVPEYDGKAPMRDYERRVRLFESATGIDPCYRAQKLMERLSGAAWTATEGLELQELKHEEGVQRLLKHLP